jgi:hypothetical protein
LPIVSCLVQAAGQPSSCDHIRHSSYSGDESLAAGRALEYQAKLNLPINDFDLTAAGTNVLQTLV